MEWGFRGEAASVFEKRNPLENVTKGEAASLLGRRQSGQEADSAGIREKAFHGF
jgi:hypothetical protein